MSDEQTVDLENIAEEWRERFDGGIDVVCRSGSDLEVHRREPAEALPTSKSLVGWYVPEDGIAYGRVPVVVPEEVAESSEAAVDAAISCLEHFESELAGRGWRITDDGTLRRDDGRFVFDATVKCVVETPDKAYRLMWDLTEDPIAYEVG